MPRFIGVILTALLFSCGGTKLTLVDWQKLPKDDFVIPPYAKHLAQYKIALDPGHGGNADIPGYKRGPTGKREAEMNLRVAFALKYFLEKVGATVFMTRTDDRFIALKERAQMSAEAGCDFMLSLHHNASDNPETNYSAVFYHLTPDQSPVSLDLARSIYFGLVDALRLPQVLDDGLLTDRLFYPAGFGVLRQSAIPAILLESSFYSNLKEEKRLTDLRYNRREAHGIFLGLARWAAGGTPETRLLAPDTISTSKYPNIQYQIIDGISERQERNIAEKLVLSESIVATIDGRRAATILSEDLSVLTVKPDSALTNGYHTVRVDLQNLFKHHNFPRTDTLIISAPADSINFQYITQYLPADTAATIPIVLSFFDEDNETVWDSTNVNVSVSRGMIYPINPTLKNGKARVYYRSGPQIGLVYLVAATSAFADTVLLSLTPAGQNWIISGEATNSLTEQAISEAKVTLNDSTWTFTDENGSYFFLNPPTGSDTLKIFKNGYATQYKEIAVDSMRSQREHFRLSPNFDGILHEQVIILDAAYDDTLTTHFFADSLDAADANLMMTQQLSSMLTWAGAKPFMVREGNEWLSPEDRIKIVNNVSDGWYMKFAYEYWDSDSIFVQTTIYPANKVGENIGRNVVGIFSTLPNTGGIILQNTDIPEVTLTNKTAIEVRIRCRKPEIVKRDLPALFRAIVEFYKSNTASN